MEDSVDAGVHPAVAAMRLAGGIAPSIDIKTLGINPKDFFKNAKKADINPLESVISCANSAVHLPRADYEKKHKKEKKTKKKGKEKKKTKKAKKRTKHKKKKVSSSSSSSSSSESSSSVSSKRKRVHEDKKSRKKQKMTHYPSQEEQKTDMQRQLKVLYSSRAAHQAAQNAADAAFSREKRCPMRPEQGHEVMRQAELRSRICIVKGGKQATVPSYPGRVGG